MISFRRGIVLGGPSRGGSGGGPPRTSDNFRKFAKVFLRKVQKMHNFSLCSTKLYKPCVNFSCVWKKNTNGWEIFDKILKIFDDNSIEKLTF